VVPQRGWGVGAGPANRIGMAASTADSFKAKEIRGTLGCEKKDAARLASDDERQSLSRTRVDAQETLAPASILRRPTETSAGCGDSSTSAATEHHLEGDGVDDQLGSL